MVKVLGASKPVPKHQNGQFHVTGGSFHENLLVVKHNTSLPPYMAGSKDVLLILADVYLTLWHSSNIKRQSFGSPSNHSANCLSLVPSVSWLMFLACASGSWARMQAYKNYIRQYTARNHQQACLSY